MIETREPTIRIPCADAVSGSLSLTLLDSTVLWSRSSALAADNAPFGRRSQPVASTHGDMEMLTIREVSKLLKCSERSVRNLSKTAGFPEPRKLGSSTRWVASEVRDWIKHYREKTAEPV